MSALLRTCRRLLYAFLLISVAGPAFAVRTVGPAGSGCEFTTVQGAINQILANERNGDYGDPFIGLRRGSFNEALTINGTNIADPRGAVVGIFGGYDFGCGAPEDGQISIINATNKSGSVFLITGNSTVSLNRLTITGARNSSGSAHGGGINFDGQGLLDLIAVDIVDNRASFGGGIFANGQLPGVTLNVHEGVTIENNAATNGGGGIYFDGSGEADLHDLLLNGNQANQGGGVDFAGSGKLVVGAGTIIANNTANQDGGGIRMEGNSRLFMDDDQTFIHNNHAPNGSGGGIDIVGPARADIGSPGYLFGTYLAALTFNDAFNGGGIAVHENAVARIFSIDAANPLRIESNSALQHGGGVYLGASSSGFGTLCAFGYRIDANIAADGAAIYADSVDGNGGQALLTLGDRDTQQACAAHESALALGAAPCAVGVPCNTIDDNTATGGDAAVILIGGHGEVEADRVELRRNTAGHILHTSEVLGSANWSSCLMVDNTLGNDVMRLDDGGDLLIEGCTITHNDIAEISGGFFPPILYVTGDLILRRTILWQPRTASLLPGPFDGGGQVTVRDVFCADNSIVHSVSATNCEPFGNPGFVNEAAGDYHLRPDSFAVDRTDFALATDLEGNPRGIRLFPHGQPSDIGAYELQSVPPGTCSGFDGVFCSGFDN